MPSEDIRYWSLVNIGSFIPSTIYVDLESLIKKVDGCKNDTTTHLEQN